MGFKWGWTSRHTLRLIEAANVVQELRQEETGPICPVYNLQQANAIASVEPEQRVEVIQKAKSVADAEERPMTARDIKEAAKPAGTMMPPVVPPSEWTGFHTLKNRFN